ncbi:peroxisomal biogenesis factor 19-like [Actinia tenebrosa]|uniref:Peroxin-19 n=1 Tax=Actinia tenebrosa TaxID=6105 RepID=A0A6P8HUJ7_ACTTE|nr:peroxisomal biogenesis factor 19-like [Actinia tenebrosa]
MADEVKKKEVCDEELDDLLDSALSDFDKPAVPPTKKANSEALDERKTNDETTDQKASGTATHSADNMTPSSTTTGADNTMPSEDELSKIFATSFADAAADLEKAMKNMGGDYDQDFVSHLNKLAESAKTAAVQEHPEAMGAFEENLAKTMSDMAQNTKDLENCGPDLLGDDLLKAMSGMGVDGSGEFDMMPLMQGMMKNLLSKEILYPSLKELNEKYPEWLESNKSKHSSEDHGRFTRQYQFVGQLCQEYESEKPDDTDEVSKKRFEKIMELMQKMQECGQPPEELVGQNIAGPFPPEMPAGMPEMPADLQDQCKVS